MTFEEFSDKLNQKFPAILEAERKKALLEGRNISWDNNGAQILELNNGTLLEIEYVLRDKEGYLTGEDKLGKCFSLEENKQIREKNNKPLYDFQSPKGKSLYANKVIKTSEPPKIIY